MTDTTTTTNNADAQTQKPRKPRKLSQYVCITQEKLDAIPQQRETVKSSLLSKIQKDGEDGVEYVILREVARVKVHATTTRKLKAA